MIDTTDALHAHANLRYIVDHWHVLQSRLIPGGGNALTGMPSGSDAPAPIDIAVSDLLFEIEEEARSLGHVLMDETTWTPSTSAMPMLLAEVAERYGHWTAGDERTAIAFCDWAEEYATKVLRALQPPAPATYIGACRGHWDDGTLCNADLYLRAGQMFGKCRVCGAEFTRDEQMRVVDAELEARLMTQTEIYHALTILDEPVPLPTIKSWAQRGRLPEVGGGLYRLTDALVLARDRGTKMAARG